MLYADGNFHKYDIFIHDKGQFWPRLNMLSFGQTDAVTIDKDEEIDISFSIKEISNMNTEDDSYQCEMVIHFKFYAMAHQS